MEERHRRILIKQNPHWVGKGSAVPKFRRDSFDTLKKYLRYPQIIAVIGLRRVGKTVLLKQLMESLMGTKKKENICYISFDDRDFQKYETAEELINYFLESSDRKKRRYLFLDEIQKVPDWTDLLKTVYETEANLKLIVSGSSSIELKRYRETLAGRIMTINIPVFTFREFVRYRGLEHRIRLSSLMGEYDLRFMQKKDIYEKMFGEYLAKGAFPELLDVKDAEFIKKYISESVIEKVIADLAKQIKPEREDIVYEMLRIFSRNTGGVFEILSLCGSLKINRNLASQYVRLLERSFLIKIFYNHTKSVIKQVRASKKAYIAHPSIPIALLDYPMDIVRMDSQDTGHLVESAIVSHIEKASFWRTPQKDEVDIIAKLGKETVPMEVKYKGDIGRSDLKGLEKFMKKAGSKRGIVITKSILKKEGKILYIPAWLFLLVEF